MITTEDLYDIMGNKITKESQKAIIRENFPREIAEKMCDAIDSQEKAERFQRFLKEWNEWIVNQQRQQQFISQFLQQYYR